MDVQYCRIKWKTQCKVKLIDMGKVLVSQSPKTRT